MTVNPHQPQLPPLLTFCTLLSFQVNIGVFNALVGAMGFPFAFTIIVVCGAELFTSMCAYTSAAWWEGKVRSCIALTLGHACISAHTYMAVVQPSTLVVGLNFALPYSSKLVMARPLCVRLNLRVQSPKNKK